MCCKPGNRSDDTQKRPFAIETFLWRNKEKFFSFVPTLQLIVTAITRPVTLCNSQIRQSTYRCSKSFSHLSNRRSSLNGNTESRLHRYGHRSQTERCTDSGARFQRAAKPFGRVSFVTFLWRNKEKFFSFVQTLQLTVTAITRPVIFC